MSDQVSEIDEILDRFWYQAIWSNDDDSIDFMAEKTSAKTRLSKMLVEAKIGEALAIIFLLDDKKSKQIVVDRVNDLKKEKSNDE